MNSHMSTAAHALNTRSQLLRLECVFIPFAFLCFYFFMFLERTVLGGNRNQKFACVDLANFCLTLALMSKAHTDVCVSMTNVFICTNGCLCMRLNKAAQRLWEDDPFICSLLVVCNLGLRIHLPSVICCITVSTVYAQEFLCELRQFKIHYS